MDRILATLLLGALLTVSTAMLAANLFPAQSVVVLALLFFGIMVVVEHAVAYLLRRSMKENSLLVIEFFYLATALVGIALSLLTLDIQYTKGHIETLKSSESLQAAILRDGLDATHSMASLFPDSFSLEGQAAGDVRLWSQAAAALVRSDSNPANWRGFADSSEGLPVLNSKSVRTWYHAMKDLISDNLLRTKLERRVAWFEKTHDVARLLGYFAIVFALALRVLRTSVQYFGWYANIPAPIAMEQGASPPSEGPPPRDSESQDGAELTERETPPLSFKETDRDNSETFPQ